MEIDSASSSHHIGRTEQNDVQNKVGDILSILALINCREMGVVSHFKWKQVNQSRKVRGFGR